MIKIIIKFTVVTTSKIDTNLLHGEVTIGFIRRVKIC